MPINYTRGLQNIQNRRFDKELNESVLTKAFSDTGIPENIRYVWESMKPIPDKSNTKTFEAAKRVQDHLEGKFNLHFYRDYRTQGSVTTKTNIAVHSDYDLLTLVRRYHYVAPPLTVTHPYTDSEPKDDMADLRSQAEQILKSIYDEVDTSGAKSVKVFNKHLNRKVDVVFGFWYNTKEFVDTGNEIHRGIYLYNFLEKKKEEDFPFKHSYSVNVKGDATNDGSRKGIRLLKNIKVDSDQKIELTSFQLTTIVHSIENSKVFYMTGGELSIAQAISHQLDTLINNPSIRSEVISPNATEKPLTSDTVPQMQKLKTDLDTVIRDAARELSSSYLQRRLLTY